MTETAASDPRPGRPRLRLVVAFAAGVLVLAALLVLQRARGGWPFSPPEGAASRTPEHLDHEPAPSATEPSGKPGVPPRAAITADPERLGRMGVTFGRVERGPLETEVRAVATIVPDESLISHVHTRVSGWIERLYVQTTGEHVREGEPLAAIFSQELLASQNEYLAALRAAPPGQPSALAEGARSRLRVLGMNDADIRALVRRGRAERNVVITAPTSGVVLHRGVTVGTAVDPSTELFTLADLSRVWVFAEVPESHLQDVHVGTPARIDLAGIEGSPIEARVDFVYPTLTERTRTMRVRFVLENPGHQLRPGMFGTAVFSTEPRVALVVPRDAIVDTGRHQHVFLVGEDGTFTPREVEIGARLGDHVEVLRGLEEGESIVTSGVFLIDSESRLRASGGAGAHAHGAPPEAGERDAERAAPAPHGGHGAH